MNIEEIKRFVGVSPKNHDIDEIIISQWNEIDAAATKRYRVQPFEVLSPPFPFEGESIKKHLKGCKCGYLFVATIGGGVDTLIRQKQITSMRDAVIADAAASSYLEDYCDSICVKLSAKQKITSRFSPGYGDLPLSSQPLLLKAAGAEKIGVSCLESLMMVPAKTVSAIIGILE